MIVVRERIVLVMDRDVLITMLNIFKKKEPRSAVCPECKYNFRAVAVAIWWNPDGTSHHIDCPNEWHDHDE